MRATLLIIFSGLTFLLALVTLQAILMLDAPQMRWTLVPFLGIDSDQRHALGRTPKDLLAYAVAFALTGTLSWRLRRLLYRHHA